MNAPRTTRREVLAGAAVALAGIALPAWSAFADEGESSGQPGVTVILQNQRHALPHNLRQRMAGNGAQLITLEADPVRQWRGESASLLAARDTRLLGITSWPQFLMVRGLAEDSGRRVRHQHFDSHSGGLIWLIA